jgi:P-type Cu+ transporter
MREKPSKGEEIRDPVCGMTIDRKTGVKDSFENRDYYFCSEECQHRFEKEPSKYATKPEEVRRT